MAKRIKFPTFSSAEKLKLIFGSKSRPIEIDDTSAVKEALMNGRFVLAWDKENAADDYPSIGALKAVTQSRCGEISYTVLWECGYEATYKHAALVDESLLPCVVAKRYVDYQPFLGRLIGCYLDENCDWVCAVKLNRSGIVYFQKAADIAFVKDVNFGIVEEENGNT